MARKIRFLIDTDILIDFFHNQEYTKKLYPNLFKRGSLFVSVISVAELRAGFTKEQANFFLPRLYKVSTIVDLNREMSELGGEFRHRYNKHLADMLIAATAIVEKCQLVTRNKKDFPMPHLKFYPLE